MDIMSNQLLLRSMPKSHMLFKEELFVPILCIAAYKDFDEALKLCNESEYGLTSGIYSTKKEEIDRFLDNSKSGVVYVNRTASATTGAMVAFSAIWWLERFWYDGQRSRRTILFNSISKGAEPDCCYLIKGSFFRKTSAILLC